MNNILKIIINPNPILRKISKNIDLDEIKKIKDFSEDMKKTMLEKDGIGLAAPQVGKNIRLIVVNTKEGALAMFNPKITQKSWAKEWDGEGCLSVPGIFGEVRRPKKIKGIYYNEKGNIKNIEATGLLARVIQHEIDHLDGILFIDKAKNLKKN